MTVKKALWFVASIIYFPIYVFAWLLHKVARILLAVSYFGLLLKRQGMDILKNLFKHG